MNREIVRQLNKLGVKVRAEVMPDRKECATMQIPDIEAMKYNQVPQDTPLVCGMLAPRVLSFNAPYRIVYTMMESLDVPKNYIDLCNMSDEIWLPTDFNVQSFKESGLTKPVTKVPLGVNPHLFNPDAQPAILNDKNGKPLEGFTFVSVFGWSLRKGSDVLIKAFCKAFNANDNVNLVIFSRYWGSEDAHYNNQIAQEIQKFKELSGNPNPPKILHFGKAVPEELLPSIYTGGDCFVLPSRGEGWGLPICEAGACGIPIITTRTTGQMEFLDDETAYLVDVDEVGQIKDLGRISSYYTNAKFPLLKEGAVDQLAEYMKHVVNNYDEAVQKGQKLSDRILNNYTWELSARHIVKRLAELKQII